MRRPIDPEELADLRANLAFNVRRLRRARGWRQVDLAERAGVDRNTVLRMEEGSEVELTTLLRLKVALGAPLSAFVWHPPEYAEIPTFEQD